MNIDQRIILTNGRSSGFDYMRLVLAITVITVHTVVVCYGRSADFALQSGFLRPAIFAVVPAFFALSGFLLSGSLDRVKTVSRFLTLRVVRMVPALYCDVLFSALIIGPVVTLLPLSQYFSESGFYLYFLNLVGRIHFYLPGVFVHNPFDNVNIQLWTLPGEIKSCFMLVIAGVLTIRQKPRLFFFVAVALNILAFAGDWADGYIATGFSPPGRFVISCFVWGAFLYTNRERIPYSPWLCLAAIAASWILIADTLSLTYLAPLPLAYITIFMGLLNPAKRGPVATGEYSYGLYVYGFSVQQTIAYLLPNYRVWYIHLPLSLAIASALAWLSWTFVESRALAQKRKATAFTDTVTRVLADRWRDVVANRLRPPPIATSSASLDPE